MISEQFEKKIAISTRNGLEFVNVQHILRCEASGKNTVYTLEDGNEILSNTTMKKVEASLVDFNFFRVHHSHLINLGKIKGLYTNKTQQLMLENGTSISVSNRKKKSFLNQFKII